MPPGSRSRRRTPQASPPSLHMTSAGPSGRPAWRIPKAVTSGRRSPCGISCTALTGWCCHRRTGNGVTEKYQYDPRTQRLVRHTTSRPDTHPQGALLISDLHYTYDPAGNILTLEDKGTDPAWHNNQQTTGLRTYAYDTLYRLTSATGRERHPVNPDDPTPARSGRRTPNATRMTTGTT
ncbi:hypothetical protein QN095_02260 [Enterobacter cloacae]|uniref:hypothetical protein n=1 Tax=Enterobacter cloacae TaxID=550 RepID=UPI00253FC675|nr:hypothetical protein [Enterobacter cloacae]WIF62929.1 hypothetical protein QN095_02260 [Enterobacter cloacae]